MISLVEKNASCDVYSVLKRSDEKFVTEKGFCNPKFVEDIVRDIALELKADKNITWFAVGVENYESIHNHNAYAYITSGQEPCLL
jgi:GTP cyclohydrolase I